MMNEWLAQMYGTNASEQPAAQSEEQQKLATAELFCKLAADSGVDLSEYNDEQIQSLYNDVMLKQAQGEEGKPPPFPPKKEEKKEKEEDKGNGEDKGTEEKAKMEYEEKKAFAEKFAEADFMGRTMAHSMVDELGHIQKAAEAGKPAEPPKEQPKEAAAPAQPAPATDAKSGSPNFDLIAARHAVKLAEASEYNVEEATQRLQAILTLGAKESEKVAYTQDFESAKHIRALELLEAAKYPVNWEEVFGKPAE